MTTEIIVHCRVRDAARIADALAALGWGRQWIDEPWSQQTNDDGYVLSNAAPDAAATVHAWTTVETDTRAPPTTVLRHAVTVALEPRAEAPIDWNVAWRDAHATRIEIAPGWVLCPPWAAPHDGERAVIIEPGGAFGTGAHPTTAHCLALLHATRLGGARVLDLGTGSGVLAIAAVLWGAREVVAVDCEANAREQVVANMKRNGLDRERIRIVTADLASVLVGGTTWDVVLCNVGASPLVAAMPALRTAIATGGTLIGSGIWHASVERVCATARACNFGDLDRRDGEGWFSFAWM